MEASISAEEDHEATEGFDEMEDFFSTFSNGNTADMQEPATRFLDTITQEAITLENETNQPLDISGTLKREIDAHELLPNQGFWLDKNAGNRRCRLAEEEEWLEDFKGWWNRRRQRGGNLPEVAPHALAPLNAEASGKGLEAGATTRQCNIFRLDGHCLVIHAPEQEYVRWIKAQIAQEWGIPACEQTLLCGTSVCSNNDLVGEVLHSAAEDSCCGFMCIRSCPFGFLPELSHPELQISDGGDSIQHGGYGSYQAGFFSEVLDAADHYDAHVQFSSISDWTMIFIGVAKDSKRDWSNVTGAYIAYTNRCGGFFIDDFHSPGWVSSESIRKFFTDHRQARTIDFIVRMDMPRGRLSCLTLDNVELASVQLDINHQVELASVESIRFVANVCHPGHKVRIVASAPKACNAKSNG